MKKKYYFGTLLATAVVVLSSCTKTLYTYKDYDDATYTYVSSLGGEKVDMKNIQKSYQTIVGEKQMKKKMKNKDSKTNFDEYRIPPGACADYGFLLCKQKDTTNAQIWFNKEVELYPESKTYVDKLRKEFGL